MNKKILIVLIAILIVLGAGLLLYYSNNNAVIKITNTSDTSITYTNNMYGFTFTLPLDWKGYSIDENTWKGTNLVNTVIQSGPRLFIRHPKWTTANPYEDLPILVFTIYQWDAYLIDNFSVFAAPIKASELGRNSKYVFVLPPRWDFDYSVGYKEAQDIIAGKPLQTFNVETVEKL